MPAIGLASEKFQELRKAQIYARRVTSFYYGAVALLTLCDFTLWLLLTIAAEHPNKFHAGWVAEWVGWSCGCTNCF